MKYDYLVIGAGAAGLTSATVLASEGYRVALIEKAPRTAPLLRGFSRRGVYFDTGFHYTGGLGQGECLDLFFRYLGLSDQLQTIPFNREGFDVVRRFGRSDFAFPIGLERLRERLHGTFPREKTAIDAYLESVRQICTQLPYLDLDADIGGAVFGPPTLSQGLKALTGDRELQRLLAVHTLLYGVSAEEVSFAMHGSVVGPYYQSVHGLAGGGLRLVEAFETRLAQLGVDIFCGRGVEQIRFSPAGELQGVELDGGEFIEGNGCVASMHPSRLLRMVPEGTFRPAYRKRLAALEDSGSAFILYGIGDRLPELLHERNLFLLDGEGKNLGDTLYLTATGTNPGGRYGLIAICPMSQQSTEPWAHSASGRRPTAYNAYKNAVAERLLHRIQTRCPEIGAIEVVETATPLTMRDYLHAPSGALYGVKHRVGQYNPMAQTRARNLLLAGQAAAAPGVLGAVLSGFLACGIILGHEQLRNKVKACR